MVAMVSARLADEFLSRLEISVAIEHPLVDQNPTGVSRGVSAIAFLRKPCAAWSDEMSPSRGRESHG
jgi:hypothetical protein